MRIKLHWGGLATLGLVALGTINPLEITTAAPAKAKPTVTAPATPSQAKGGLTEENLQQAVDALQKAQSQENLAGVLYYLAPFVSSEITIEGDESSQTIVLDGKEKHSAVLKDMFSRIKSREILSQDVNIRLSDDKSLGIVTIYTVKSLTTENGKNYLYSDVDTLRFAWLDNHPTLISSKSKGWLADTTNGN